jgi:hypothetical protein
VALLPLAFAAMHLGFGVGMWQGLVAAGLAHATDNGRPTTPENGA